MLQLEVKIKLAEKELVDNAPKLRDAELSLNEVKQSYLFIAEEINSKLSDLEKESLEMIQRVFQEILQIKTSLKVSKAPLIEALEKTI